MSAFGGERFLDYALPDYAAERTLLLSLGALSLIFWWIVVPFFVATFLLRKNKKTNKDDDTRAPKRTVVVRTSTTKNGSTRKTVVLNGKRKKKKKKGEEAKKRKQQQQEEEEEEALMKEEQARKEVDDGILLVATIFETIGLLATILVLISYSSNNRVSSRGVWEAPLLTKAECQTVLDMAAATARRNYERAQQFSSSSSSSGVAMEDQRNNSIDDETIAKLLQEPEGWQKSRHASYPTIDLNLVTDPFTPEERTWLKETLDRRLAPLIQRIYGVVPSAIRANDIFVVRYDAEKQPFLSKHTDDSDISFNVLLTDEFEGGGTRFWNRLINAPFVTVKPSRVGQVLTHSALIHHEGLPITKGLRYILVGFLSVDRMDPMTHKPTGLSWFVSWWSIPYMHNKLKDGYTAAHSRLEKRATEGGIARWSDNKYVRSVFLFLVLQLEKIGDELCPHLHYNLVKNEGHIPDYLQSLDEAFDPSDSRLASWFEGQQLNLDVDGTLASEWTTKQSPQSSPSSTEDL